MMNTKCSIIAASLFLFSFTTSTAQNFKEFNKASDVWSEEWSNFSPNNTDYPEAEEKLPNIIDNDTYLANDVVYLMSGDVYVTNNASLTIEEGTIIRCDYENPANLIVSKGAKLIAAGSRAFPIVFTSNKAAKSRTSGDWGGITIAGSGKVNTVSGNGLIEGEFNPQFSTYGGKNHNEETVILNFVRIEFSGNSTKRKSGTNGLSLYGIGSSSVLQNIMISHSAQNSFNIKGGKNNAQNLISLKAQGNDYQVAEGFKGDLNNIMAVRHPYIASPKGSYALSIEGHNTEMGYTNAITDITVSNAVLVTLSDKTNYQHTYPAIYATNSAMTYIHNSKISGFSDVIKFDKSYTSMAVIQKAFMMDNSFFNIHSNGIKVANKYIQEGTLNILKYNRFTENFTGFKELFEDIQNNKLPNFELKHSLNNYMVMQ